MILNWLVLKKIMLAQFRQTLQIVLGKQLPENANPIQQTLRVVQVVTIGNMSTSQTPYYGPPDNALQSGLTLWQSYTWNVGSDASANAPLFLQSCIY